MGYEKALSCKPVVDKLKPVGEISLSFEPLARQESKTFVTNNLCSIVLQQNHNKTSLQQTF